MRRRPAISTDLRTGAWPVLPAWKAIAGALTIGVLLLATMVLAAVRFHEPVAVFTQDGSALGNLPWYSGSVSLLNGMVWAVVAGLSLLVAWLEPEDRLRLSGLALFTGVLAADDALQLHEVAGPDNGIPQPWFLALYAASGLVLLALFVLGGRPGPLIAFLLGLGLLGISVAFDEVVSRQILIIEDGSKLMGAVMWLAVPVIVAGRLRRGRDLPAPVADRSALEREHQQA
ncbi:hypothetical protein [Modestobacter marinus]|uniref:hypothetical protein n=1 Tax=Modestobacter marinus TaxID=477641 RepID=UPI001C979933|nr:hypothetical protein [Modestobacter marinus]